MKKKVEKKSIELEGIDTNDYPDFADTFVSYAEYTDGTVLTENELEDFQNNNADFVYELILDSVF